MFNPLSIGGPVTAVRSSSTARLAVLRSRSSKQYPRLGCDGIEAHMDGFATLAAVAGVANHRSIARTDATGTRTGLAPAAAGGDRAGCCHFGERDGVATIARLLPTHRDRLSRRTHTARTSPRRTTSRRRIDRTWTMLFRDEPAHTTVTRCPTHGDRLHLR